MTRESDFLLDLAHRIVQPYTELPTIRAAMVTGSAAKGLSDSYSDLDLTIYYADELPDEEILAEIRQQHEADKRKWLIGNREEDSFAEAYDVAQDIGGIEVQIGHTTIAAWEASIAKVLEELDCESPLQKAMEGTLACKALYGEKLINQWKAQIAAYPAPLAEAMVKKHLAFFPLWGLGDYLQTRDGTIWTYQILVEAAQNIVGTLAGLNHLYFTTFQFKRMQNFVDQMQIAPPNLSVRLERIFNAGPQGREELERLVEETVALVEKHMPTIDTAHAKRRIGWRHEPWQIEHPNPKTI